MKKEFDAASFALAIQTERIRRGLSMRQVAEEAGISGGTLSRVLTGADRYPPSRPSLEVFISLMAWMGRSNAMEFMKREETSRV